MGDELVCTDEVGGVARFDGQRWMRFLSDSCVESMDIAADGSVWLLAIESDRPISHPPHLRHHPRGRGGHGVASRLPPTRPPPTRTRPPPSKAQWPCRKADNGC